MKLGHIAVGGAAGIMSLGLIGFGAHAAFTTTTQTHQVISAGTLNIVLTSTQAVTGNGTKSIKLAASTTNASSFTTGTIGVTIKNIGTVAASFVHAKTSVASSGTSADNALASQLYICVIGTPPNVLYNGPLSPGMTLNVVGAVPKGSVHHDIINVYAGKEHTACGAVTTPGATPVAGTSTAPSLTNAAEGGAVTVSYTLTYQA